MINDQWSMIMIMTTTTVTIILPFACESIFSPLSVITTATTCSLTQNHKQITRKHLTKIITKQPSTQQKPYKQYNKEARQRSVTNSDHGTNLVVISSLYSLCSTFCLCCACACIYNLQTSTRQKEILKSEGHVAHYIRFLWIGHYLGSHARFGSY